MLNKDGYSHEIVTDEDGRTWLKPAVTIVVTNHFDVTSPALSAKQLNDEIMRQLHPRKRRRRFGRSHD